MTRYLGAVGMVGALAVMAGCGGTVTVTGGDGCTYEGKHYALGDSFPASDGCNTCSCSESGEVACTLIGCVDECTDENGQTHAIGDTFPSPDGCNTCTCLDNGSIGCTEMACSTGCTDDAGQHHNVGESFPATDGCNTCTCVDDQSIVCTEMPCVAGCVASDGTFYNVGDSWFEAAECGGQGCDCVAPNTVECEGPPLVECYYDGEAYCVGDFVFIVTNGCGQYCDCIFDGTFDCGYDAPCVCNPNEEWWRSYVATDPDQCDLIDYLCPANTGGFSNECGCGCEQDANCPEWLDCEPPTDCSSLMAACPYSKVAL